MSDDFGTQGTKKDRARELVRLREHYRLHRETLSGLVGDAPSDHLATEYERLLHEIDMAVRKLDELEGKPSAAAKPAATAGGIADTQPAFRPKTHPGHTAPGTRPLVRPDEAPSVSTPSHSRVAMILIAGVVVLGLIGYLIWYASSGRQKSTATIVEQPVTTTTSSTAPPAITPATATIAPAGSLKISPALADYGTIRKGTRAVRQFEVVNSSGAPVEIQVARSTCRCLYYDYKAKLPAGGRETITVTIDGGRAKSGDLSEQVQVTAKNDRGIVANFTVQAVIQ
jgi:hypothetical protein